MILNITAPTTIDKIKWNMFLTNEYGKPSMEWLDNFIENFSGSLINGNFIITENHKEDFDKLWSAIEEDLDERNLASLAHNNYGWYFYRQLSEDCNNKIKSADELTVYLLNYFEEQHQHLIDKEKSEIKGVAKQSDDINIASIDLNEEEGEVPRFILDFNRTPDLIKTDLIGKRYIECTFSSNGNIRHMHLYEDNSTKILSGAYIEELKQCAGDTTHRYRMKYKHLISSDNILISDVILNSPSAAGALCYGAGQNGWKDIKNRKGQPIDIYRVTEKTDELIEPSFEIKHYNLRAFAKRRKDLELICENSNGEVVEELLLDINTKHVLVVKTTIDKLDGEEFESFEDYIIQYFRCRCNNVEREVLRNYNNIMNQIQQDKIWFARVGFNTRPLTYIYDYEEI